MESTKRPSFIQIFAHIAAIVSRRSTCKRLQVGSVIVSSDFTRVLSVGYNGNAKGFDNTCDREEPGNCGCIHSEINALLKVDYSEKDKVIFVTDTPCENCAKAIINADIKKVYYIREYRKKDSLEMFKRANIHTEKVDLQNIDIGEFLPNIT
jgi:dCMP deaminase